MNIVYLLIGWLLGLLSIPIGERIKRYYQKNDVRSGIISELKEIKVRLVYNIFRLTMKSGISDKQLLEWVKKQLEGYEGSYPTENLSLMLKKLSYQIDDKQLAVIQSLTSNEESELSLKKFYLPFLESRIDLLPLFGGRFRTLIFEIWSQIQTLNEEIDNSQFFYRKTFDSSMSVENHERVRQNLEQCYKNINSQAKTMVERINNLISSKG